jgi:hypothetical protein
MDHRRIDEQNVAELYVTGRLSTEDEETFESHLLECAECRERVGWADDLRTSIRAVAAEDVARASAQLGFLAWISRRTRTARTGLLMAALLAVAALPVWLQADRARLSRELDEARAAARSETAAPLPAAPVPAPVAPSAPTPVPDPELGRLAQENSRLEAELDRLREPRSTRIVSLGVVRGAADAQEIEVGPSSEPIVLSLPLSQVEYDTYRVTLLAGKSELWQGGGLVPDGNDFINIQVDSASLKPGTVYRCRIEGLAAGGRAIQVDELSFRAVKG